MFYPVTIENKTFEIDFKAFPYEIRDGVLVLDNQRLPYNCIFDKQGKLSAVQVFGKLFRVSFPSAGFQREVTEANYVYAPLNGQVIKAFAKEGDSINAGDLVLILEAMKMENEMVSPASGILRKLNVREKEVVKAGHLLFQVEPTSG